MPRTLTLAPDALEHIIFFKGLSSDHLAILRAAAKHVSFAEGEVVAKEGEPSQEFFLIKSGALVVECLDEDGEAIALQEVGPGELIGWSWIIPPNLWTFDVRTTKPSSAFAFDGTALRQACRKDPTLGFELMLRVGTVMAMRLQEARARMAALHSLCRRELHKDTNEAS